MLKFCHRPSYRDQRANDPVGLHHQNDRAWVFGKNEWSKEDIESIRCRDRTMNLGANPKVGFRWAGVPIALASTGAMSLVALLSFGGEGAARILGRIGPIRSASQFFSRTYDRLLDQLGQEVLQDSRDTPALRLMVSLSLTAIPIFLIQLVLGKPRLLLAIAFYISLYGFRFQQFVRMFSAKHLEAHRRQGYFKEKYDRIFGRYVEFFLGYLYGNVPELDRTVHVRLHHRENGGFDDTAESRGYDRKSRLDFLRYLSNNIWTRSEERRVGK